MRPVDAAFFERPADAVARDLIGVGLLVNGSGGGIVETEAYHGADPASHSFRGPTKRNAVMFGPAGCAYVYLSYGLHWCFNVVCEPGSAVLIRALEPVAGIDEMQARRGITDTSKLCAGPGRLCKALAITGALNGASLFDTPFELYDLGHAPAIRSGPRIGLSVAVEEALRFGEAGSQYLSKPF